MNLRVLLCILVLLSPVAPAQERPLDTPVSHQLLLDVSGSLRDRGYAERRGGKTFWGPTIPNLVSQLLAPGDPFFSEADRLMIQPFSDRVTDAREQRAALGPFSLAELNSLQGQLPTPGAGATDMARSLDMAEELASASGAKTVLTWLITDNENNLSGNTSDAEFYERLRASPAYDYVYFFPLAKPEAGENHPLVMYLLVHHTESEDPWVADLVEKVQEKTGFEGVLFRPLYGGGQDSVLKFDRQMNFLNAPPGSKVDQEAGATVLTLTEGERLRGNLQFKVKSNLKGWEIVNATLENAKIRLSVPNEYRQAGDLTIDSPVTPKTLSVAPKQTTVDFHLLSLNEAKVVLERPWSKKLAHPFKKWLSNVEGRLKMRAILDLSPTDLEDSPIRPALSDEMRSRVRSIPNLAEIEHFMVFQLDEQATTELEDGRRVIDFERNLIVRVQASTLPRLLVMLLLSLLLVMILAFVWVVFFWRVRLTLEAPDGQHQLNLVAFHSDYSLISPQGEPLAALRARLGQLTIKPEIDCTVEGVPEELQVRFEGSEFPFELGFEHKSERHMFVLHKAGAAAGAGSDEPAPEL